MKLAAYVCSQCDAALDTDDPRWLRADGADYHRCDAQTLGWARLKRSAARQEQIDDERQALTAAAPKIATEARRAVLQRELQK